MDYSYRCTACGKTHTLTRKMGEAPARTECPHCGQLTLVRSYEPTPNIWRTPLGTK